MWLIWTSIPSRRPGGASVNRPRAELVRKSIEARQSYLRFIRMGRLPNEIVLPAAVAWNLVALHEARARGERTGESISVEGSLPVNTIHDNLPPSARDLQILLASEVSISVPFYYASQNRVK
jgi:hypothetical protein